VSKRWGASIKQLDCCFEGDRHVCFEVKRKGHKCVLPHVLKSGMRVCLPWESLPRRLKKAIMPLYKLKVGLRKDDHLFSVVCFH
jgi:hypothetical protein